MTLVSESETLHARVRAVAEREQLLPSGDFDDLALDLTRYQMKHVAGFRRLVEAAGGEQALRSADDIPAVPVDAFRVTRVATYPAAIDAARFSTSGTTGAAPGVHVMRTTDTYRFLSLAWGRRALASAWPGPRVVVALAPEPSDAPTSSLGFMMRAFMEEFDGRALSGAETLFGARSRERWLLTPDGVDVEGLRHAAHVALRRAEPLLVLATGSSLVLLLDALSGGTIASPDRTVVMPTGGFKGRTRELAPRDLAREVARAFGVPEGHVVGEYGMTELSSQLYEGTLPGGSLSGPRSVFLPPPWLRVTPVDPVTLAPVRDGETGIARFVDLGNIDSAVAIVTQDLIRRSGVGIEFLGRSPGACPRGCSLSIDEFVLGARPA